MMYQEESPSHERRPSENDGSDHADGKRESRPVLPDDRSRRDRICHSNYHAHDYEQQTSGHFPAPRNQCQDHEE